MKLISCENLSIGYKNKQVVENLTFSLEEKNFLCILGENGSGKSTLMKTILRLKKPLSGKINYGEGLKKGGIGYLPQQTPAQKDFPATAFEIVLSGTLGNTFFLPIYTKKQKQAALESMSILGISDLEKRCFRELSGGQQQRVLLARALCASKKLIVLDEPTAALDPDAAEEMYLAINDLYKSGISVIMVSHDAATAVKYATHVLHIAARPKFFGTVEDYLETDLWKKSKSRVPDIASKPNITRDSGSSDTAVKPYITRDPESSDTAVKPYITRNSKRSDTTGGEA